MFIIVQNLHIHSKTVFSLQSMQVSCGGATAPLQVVAAFLEPLFPHGGLILLLRCSCSGGIGIQFLPIIIFVFVKISIQTDSPEISL